MNTKVSITISILLLCLSTFAHGTMPIEVKFLINEIKQSDCSFIRNGLSHSAKRAAEHLTLKYNNGKSYAQNGKSFIKNLATKSAWSGIVYKITCPNKEAVNSNEWLNSKLNNFKKSTRNR